MSIKIFFFFFFLYPLTQFLINQLRSKISPCLFQSIFPEEIFTEGGKHNCKITQKIQWKMIKTVIKIYIEVNKIIYFLCKIFRYIIKIIYVVIQFYYIEQYNKNEYLQTFFGQQNNSYFLFVEEILRPKFIGRSHYGRFFSLKNYLLIFS